MEHFRNWFAEEIDASEARLVSEKFVELGETESAPIKETDPTPAREIVLIEQMCMMPEEPSAGAEGS